MTSTQRRWRARAPIAVGTTMIVLALAASARAVTVGQVNPLIGSAGGGDTVPGASVPFGFANPSPDMAGAPASGYLVGAPVLGFSATHASGTGGAGKYGNFRVTAMIGAKPTPISSPIIDEQAAPGSYSALLTRQGITAELTATRLVAFERYTFPATRDALLLVNLSSVISAPVDGQRATHSAVRLTGPRSFAGSVTVAGGWGYGTYTLYCAVAVNRDVRLRIERHAGASDASGVPLDVVVGFDASRQHAITVKLALSFGSEQAAEQELSSAGKTSFDEARAQAGEDWAAALGRISTAGASAAQQETFATALFHAETMPHDLSGDGSWPAGQSHYEDLYTLWDTYRTVNPLLTILEPAREVGIVRTLLWIDHHDGGFLPDARVATNNGITQVGSNGEIVIADAILNGLGGFDRTSAYDAIVRDAEVSSPHPGSDGRDLRDYARLGYVATDEGRSASRTLEYAYEDYVVSEVAALLGHTATAAMLSRRAEDWENLWDPAEQSIVPRNADGSFLEPFDPTEVFYGFDAPFYEGSALEWSTFVPQDVQGLVNRLGGDSAAASWLSNVMNCCYDPTDEPDLLAAYEFIQMGHPELTDFWVSRLLANYGDESDGLPGNDDAGTLSAWYVWSAIGLYPNAGQPYYFIGSPIFTSTRIALGNGRTFTINAPNSSAQNIYVDGAMLDGAPLARAFITSGELERGGTLILQMGAEPDGWGDSTSLPSLSAPPAPSQ